METKIQTRILIISDTHAEALNHQVTTRADVAIHCGDLTEESKLSEFRFAIEQLKALNAPIKLVIAGNHDFTLDDEAYAKTRDEVKASINDEALITSTYGTSGQAKALFQSEDAKAAGIVFLDEGTHKVLLDNGALLTVYASPYTSSKSSGWGFQYDPQLSEHNWEIENSTDVVITHGPPLGLLDNCGPGHRAGSSSLFAAIANSKPKVHCFGHIHGAWGAKKVTWRPEISDEPSHFTAIEESTVVETRTTLYGGKADTQEMIKEKLARRTVYMNKGYRNINDTMRTDEQTLFVNAAIEGNKEGEQQLPWLIDVPLSRQQSVSSSSKKRRATVEEPVAKRFCPPPKEDSQTSTDSVAAGAGD